MFFLSAFMWRSLLLLSNFTKINKKITWIWNVSEFFFKFYFQNSSRWPDWTSGRARFWPSGRMFATFGLDEAHPYSCMCTYEYSAALTIVTKSWEISAAKYLSHKVVPAIDRQMTPSVSLFWGRLLSSHEGLFSPRPTLRLLFSSLYRLTPEKALSWE